MAYLSDEKKVFIKQILMLWDEKGGLSAEPPTFKEFDSDPRTPRGSSLAWHFGTYAEAVKEARAYFNKRERLDDPPKINLTPTKMTRGRDKKRKKPTPKTESTQVAKPAPAPMSEPSPKPEPAKKPEPAQTETKPQTAPTIVTAKPSEAPETPKPEKSDNLSSKTPKTAPGPSTERKSSNNRHSFKFGSQLKQKREDQRTAPLRQSLADCIPQHFLDQFEDNPPAPAQKPETPPEPALISASKPAPEPEEAKAPIAVPEPEETQESSTNLEPKAPEETPGPTAVQALEIPESSTNEMLLGEDSIINYLPHKIAFISEKLCRMYLNNELRPDESFAATENSRIIAPNHAYASIAETKIIIGRYRVDTEKDQLYIPITSSNVTPRLIKDDLVYKFPEPKDGVLLLVERSVAEAAREDGRETDDLFFPKTYVITRSGTILCSELGKLQN